MDLIITIIRDYWPYGFTALTLLATVWTALHVVLKKNDTRAAIGWLGLVWFAPVLGVCLYWIFGVNRIQRRAQTKFTRKKRVVLTGPGEIVSSKAMEDHYKGLSSSLTQLCRLTEKVTMQPLMPGNEIIPLMNGDQAYPEMLAAIEDADRSVSMATYIFDNDHWGKKFRIALKDAVARGIEVRVLIDAVGSRYSLPSIISGLRDDGIKVSRFMKTLLPWRFRYLNLRNHRKIMVTDGTTGFTGGMNIRAGSVLGEQSDCPLQDIHFKIKGPVVAQLQQIFTEDWYFSTGEELAGPRWYPVLNQCGEVVARGIADGPDEDFDTLRIVMLGAISTARTSINIATPYFLPDHDLLTALQVAALRGVRVEILLPGTTNLRMVKWASDASLEELVRSGCRIYYTPAPFDHTKLMTVDRGWVLLGSANWDARSLSLNFEFNVECYHPGFARMVEKVLAEKVRKGRLLTLQDLHETGLVIQLRNRFFRLFTPYL
ncbi:cardiolipin synthase [Thermodesulfobacteriota bacterium]